MGNLNTFNGWKLLGRSVIRGQKGIRRNEYGDFLFSENQTTPSEIRDPQVYFDKSGRAFVRQYI